jgi:hypothetical protein
LLLNQSKIYAASPTAQIPSGVDTQSRDPAGSNDDIDFAIHQLRSQGGKLFKFPVCVPHLNVKVLPLNVAQRAQALSENVEDRRAFGCCADAEVSKMVGSRRLLTLGGNRRMCGSECKNAS